MTSLATVEHAGSIATITLRRADARNALSLDLLAALHTAVDGLASRRETSVVVLTGEGRAFCAGMDLKAVLDDPAAPLALLGSLADFCLKLRALPAVTLAKVNGAAIGGGCGVATVCDIAITHADSKMGFPEVDLGVCPAVVAPWLVRKVGAGTARMILLQGGLMSGRQAHERRIVDHLVDSADQLDAAAARIAERLATGGPEALRATKRLLNDLDGSLDAAVARRGAELSAKVLASPEAQAMLRSKLNK
ncbi:MAG: enoyl-CoA hydratase/isomerase family protein [Phycisphaerales bacterium]